MVPSHVFLDTNVFDGQQYNFDSAVFKAFIDIAKVSKIKLLLPHPTDLEIRRHIRERSSEALQALHAARRAAPFLKKWEHFPKDSMKQIVDHEITRVAGNEWHAFKANFEVVTLGYDEVSVAQVMSRYDQCRPPFGQGKKRKEFPDAFAVAILEVFAGKHDLPIAIVSRDEDFKAACKTQPRFLSFSTLPELTELLVLGPDVLDATRQVILSNTDVLQEAVLNEAAIGLSYYHEIGSYTIVESLVESVEFEDVRVVAFGKNEASVAFEVLVSTSHYLEWVEHDYDDEYVTERSHTLDSYTVHGVAKVLLDPLIKCIASVVSVDFEEAELMVRETPRRR